MKTLPTKILAQILCGSMAVTFLMACSPENPDLISYKEPAPKPVVVPPKALPVYKFEFSKSESTFRQERYDLNEISALFQVLKDNQSVNGLKPADLVVQENGTAVSQFKMSADVEKHQQLVDIVFAVDITGTMTAFIETAKKRLHDFILSSRAKGYHTRMCFSTFGDYTVKKCTRFFDNNPNDPSTEAQVKELLSELSQLSAYKGVGKDPGWPDLDENPMRALIDASQAPWGNDSQRFLILVTDWGFLYSPDNQGTIGEQAPRMSEVTAAIKKSQMTVFAITPNQKGYNSTFQNEPSIVQASGGEFFEFSKVINGTISLDHILGRILQRVNTTYKISYVLDENPNLDPSLPIEKRKIEIGLKNSQGETVQVSNVHSTLPTGRPQYKKQWSVSDSPVLNTSMRVYLDGKEVPPDQYQVSGTEVQFNKVPAPGSKLRFVFYYQDFHKNFRFQPMSFEDDLNTQNAEVYLNGIKAKDSDFAFEKDLANKTSLRLSESVLDATDPYEIHKNKGLTVQIKRLK